MQFELETFERADAGDEALLRVVARAPGSAAPSLGIYALDLVHRLDLESNLSPTDGVLRAEYRVPAVLLGSGPATFWLELDDGAVIDLPPPTSAGSTPSRPPVPPSASGSTPPGRRVPPPASGPVRARPTATPAPRRRAAKPEPNYRWQLRKLMAARGMYSTSDLRAPLASRGVALSTAQVYRLVTGTPERLNLKLLVALCDFLECSPNELIELGPTADRRDAGPRL